MFVFGSKLVLARIMDLHDVGPDALCMGMDVGIYALRSRAEIARSPWYPSLYLNGRLFARARCDLHNINGTNDTDAVGRPVVEHQMNPTRGQAAFL